MSVTQQTHAVGMSASPPRRTSFLGWDVVQGQLPHWLSPLTHEAAVQGGCHSWGHFPG